MSSHSHDLRPRRVVVTERQGRDTVRITLGRRQLPEPSPIPHPLGSPDFAIMRAWIEAELAAAHQPHEDRCSIWKAEGPGRMCDCRRGKAVLAAVESAIQRALEGVSRQALGAYYYRVPAAVRPLLGRQEGEGLKQLLGRWGNDGNFAAGLAGLSERESEAYWLRLRGWSPTAIAHELTPPGLRGNRARWLPVKAVYNACYEARTKVRRAFGLPATGGPEDDWERSK